MSRAATAMNAPALSAGQRVITSEAAMCACQAAVVPAAGFRS
jgi:hypothetical protein